MEKNLNSLSTRLINSRAAKTTGFTGAFLAAFLSAQEAYGKWKEKVAVTLSETGEIAVFDREEGKQDGPPNLISSPEAYPGSLKFSKDSLYVGNYGTDTLERLDSKTLQKLKELDVSSPSVMETLDDGRIMVGSDNYSFSDKVTIFNTELSQKLGEITTASVLSLKHIGDKIFALAMAADGINNSLLQISETSPNTFEITKTVSKIGSSMDVKNGLIYVGSAIKGKPCMRIFDPATLTEIAGSPHELPFESGQFADSDNIISRPNSNQIWTYGISTNYTISVFNTETKQIIKQISFSGTGVVGNFQRASFSSDGKRFYLVVDDGSATQKDVVAVFDVDDNGDVTFTGTLNLPKNSSPYDVAVDVDTDGDQITNSLDNCPDIANLDQGDFDNDGIGNYCDPTEAGYSQSIALPEGINSDGVKVNLEDTSAQQNVQIEKDGNVIKITVGEETDIMVVRTNPAIPVNVVVEPDINFFFDVDDGHIGLTKGDGTKETVGVSKDNFVPGHEQGASLALEGTSLKLDTGEKPVVNPEPQPEQGQETEAEPQPEQEKDAGIEEQETSESNAGETETSFEETCAETNEDANTQDIGTPDTAESATPDTTESITPDTAGTETDAGGTDTVKFDADSKDSKDTGPYSDTAQSEQTEISKPESKNSGNGCSVSPKSNQTPAGLIMFIGATIAALMKRRKEEANQ